MKCDNGTVSLIRGSKVSRFHVQAHLTNCLTPCLHMFVYQDTLASLSSCVHASGHPGIPVYMCLCIRAPCHPCLRVFVHQGTLASLSASVRIPGLCSLGLRAFYGDSPVCFVLVILLRKTAHGERTVHHNQKVILPGGDAILIPQLR